MKARAQVISPVLHLGAIAVAIAVPFVPYVAVGEQPYAAIGFIERVSSLSDMRIVDASWRLPPMFALVATFSMLLATLLPDKRKRVGRMAAAALSAFAAVLTYQLTAQSAILAPLLVPKLLLASSALLLTSHVLDKRESLVS